jgi:hypothetical protein
VTREEKKLNFSKKINFAVDDSPKGESQIEKRQTEKQFFSLNQKKVKKKIIMNLCSLLRNKKKNNLFPHYLMWFDYAEVREKKLSEKEDLLHSFLHFTKNEKFQK